MADAGAERLLLARRLTGRQGPNQAAWPRSPTTFEQLIVRKEREPLPSADSTQGHHDSFQSWTLCPATAAEQAVPQTPGCKPCRWAPAGMRPCGSRGLTGSPEPWLCVTGRGPSSPRSQGHDLGGLCHGLAKARSRKAPGPL